jgi:hypothetical protein
MKEFVEKWHQIVDNRDEKALDELLHDDVMFYSPVVFTPQKGKKMTKAYLLAALEVLVSPEANFSYVKETIDTNKCVLEFNATIDGIIINGVDMISLNEEGKIIEFKVMVRPLQGMNKLHEKMGEMLKNYMKTKAKKEMKKLASSPFSFLKKLFGK